MICTMSEFHIVS